MADRRNARFGPNEGPRALRRPWMTLGGGSNVAQAAASQSSVAAGAFGAQGFVQPPPILRSTFLQPSINSQYPNITWTQSQFEAEFQWMTSAGIHEIILQWTVDQDANETYFTYSGGVLPPQYNNMVGTCLAAAEACGVDVWLGLCNTYNWQAHATDNTWLYNQFYLNTLAATQLMSLFSGQFVGWYISNETSDVLMQPGADVSEQTAFFQDNTSWLHANTGLPVMTSPTYSYQWPSAETEAQFAASCAAVLGSFDVINVQDGTGDQGVPATGTHSVQSYFTALAAQFSGISGVQVWQNTDMYSYPTYANPASVATMAASMGATTGLVSKYCGFSFETHMDPLTTSPANNWSYYQAYRAYAEPYFDAKDFTASPSVASGAATAFGPSEALQATPNAAIIQALAEQSSTAVTCTPGAASASFVAYAPVSGVSALPPVASASFVAYAASGYLGARAAPAAAGVTGVAEAPSVAITTLPGAASASFVAYAPSVSLVHSAYAGVAGVTVAVYSVIASAAAEPTSAALASAAAEPPTEVISQPVYPSAALMAASAFTPTVFAFTPSLERTYFVPFEDRTAAIPAEGRVVTVAFEDRTESIPNEDRVVEIPFEDRADVVPGA